MFSANEMLNVNMIQCAAVDERGTSRERPRPSDRRPDLCRPAPFYASEITISCRSAFLHCTSAQMFRTQCCASLGNLLSHWKEAPSTVLETTQWSPLQWVKSLNEIQKLNFTYRKRMNIKLCRKHQSMTVIGFLFNQLFNNTFSRNQTFSLAAWCYDCKSDSEVDC